MWPNISQNLGNDINFDHFGSVKVGQILWLFVAAICVLIQATCDYYGHFSTSLFLYQPPVANLAILVPATCSCSCHYDFGTSHLWPLLAFWCAWHFGNSHLWLLWQFGTSHLWLILPFWYQSLVAAIAFWYQPLVASLSILVPATCGLT